MDNEINREVVGYFQVNPCSTGMYFHIFLIICRFHTASETYVRMKIVQTPAIDFLTSFKSHPKLVVENVSLYRRDKESG